MKLQKTAKARLELQPGARTLGQRERALLVLCDGKKATREFAKFFDAQLDQLVQRLVREDYLELCPVAASVAPKRTLPATARVVVRELTVVPVPPKVSADQFEGKRSMATT
jgi:hypothetical protein